MDLKASTTDELIAQALAGAEDDEQAWAAVRELHRRGSHEVFVAAKALLGSKNPRERSRGVDVLAQLGVKPLRAGGLPEPPDPQLVVACADELIELLRREKDPLVLEALGVGLGHRPDPRAVPWLADLARHVSAEVRCGVAFGLAAHANPAACEAMIRLTEDSDRDVRNWATFGLTGYVEKLDTSSLRDALVRRLDDEDEEIRGEALLGLATLRDPRVHKALRRTCLLPA